MVQANAGLPQHRGRAHRLRHHAAGLCGGGRAHGGGGRGHRGRLLWHEPRLHPPARAACGRARAESPCAARRVHGGERSEPRCARPRPRRRGGHRRAHQPYGQEAPEGGVARGRFRLPGGRGRLAARGGRRHSRRERGPARARRAGSAVRGRAPHLRHHAAAAAGGLVRPGGGGGRRALLRGQAAHQLRERQAREPATPCCPSPRSYGCAVVGLTLDEDGIPSTAEGRFAHCRAHRGRGRGATASRAATWPSTAWSWQRPPTRRRRARSCARCPW